MSTGKKTIHIVGAGLAGSECALQLADMGYSVVLYEMRPVKNTPAHKTNLFAELVCSNSFGSQTDYSASGQLKWEAKKLGSFILKAAEEASIPAGMALGVDREIFAKSITQAIQSHPNIEVRNELVTSVAEVPRPCVVATGPLTDEEIARSIRTHLSNADQEEFLYFFDAIAPIVDADSIDMSVCWKADRFDKGTKDYINCPLNKEQYDELLESITNARKIEPKEFEKTPYFDGCMPIEAMLERGHQTLRHGPMSSNGLVNPHTGERPYAVVQLRQENKEATCYNMVGFQTKMAYGDQKEVFRKIPGLEKAEFLKLGSMHRNMYIHSPRKLTKALASRKDPELFFAGQITGVEGYFDSTCIGLLVARFVADQLEGREIQLPPRESALGSLLNAITEDKKHFQPTNINFGLFPALDMKARGATERELKREVQIEKAKVALLEWILENKN